MFLCVLIFWLCIVSCWSYCWFFLFDQIVLLICSSNGPRMHHTVYTKILSSTGLHLWFLFPPSKFQYLYSLLIINLEDLYPVNKFNFSMNQCSAKFLMSYLSNLIKVQVSYEMIILLLYIILELLINIISFCLTNWLP